MIKLKDLIKILPNPQEFYLCILDEHDNLNKHDRDMIYSRCWTCDFKSFWFRDYEDQQYYSKERIDELLEYEVTCITNWLGEGKFSNGDALLVGRYNMSNPLEPEEAEKQRKLETNLFVYIAPIEKKKKKARQEEQTDLFSDIDEVTA